MPQKNCFSSPVVWHLDVSSPRTDICLQNLWRLSESCAAASAYLDYLWVLGPWEILSFIYKQHHAAHIQWRACAVGCSRCTCLILCVIVVCFLLAFFLLLLVLLGPGWCYWCWCSWWWCSWSRRCMWFYECSTSTWLYYVAFCGCVCGSDCFCTSCTAIFCCFCCFFNVFFVRGDAGGAAAHPGGREIVTCGETSWDSNQFHLISIDLLELDIIMYKEIKEILKESWTDYTITHAQPYHSAWVSLAFASPKKRDGEAKGANSNSAFAPGKLRWNPYSVTLYKVHCDHCVPYW